MRDTLTFGFIFLFFISCKYQKIDKKPVIEIYLTKTRIKSHQGLVIDDSNIDSLGYTDSKNRFNFNIIRLDTISDQLIFAGEFKASKRDLKDKPFLEANRIIRFNHKNGQLLVDSIGAKRISELSNSNNIGHQFVLTIDNEPKLFGYFYSYPFSFYCHTYTYDFSREIQKKEFELTHGIHRRKVNLEKENNDLFPILSKTKIRRE